MHPSHPPLFRRPPRTPLVTALVLSGLAPAAVGCADDPAPQGPPDIAAAPDGGMSADATPTEPKQPAAPDPMLAAYAALENADYAATPELIERLDEAFAADPTKGRLAFYAGTMRLWQSVGGPNEAGDALSGTLGAIASFEQAVELGPEDPHAHAFLGIAQIALGSILGDEERIEAGSQVFDEGIPLYPPYVHGVRTQAFGVLPRDHHYFPKAIESMYSTFAECGFDAAPDEEWSIVYPSAEDAPPGTCWNEGIVQHVWEGIFLIYGDVLVKSGDADLGRQLYEAAKLSPTYDDFVYGNELEARIATADERAALYLDDDPTNDPPIWVEGQHICVGCHASKQ